MAPLLSRVLSAAAAFRAAEVLQHNQHRTDHERQTQQQTALRDLIRYARLHSPFYRELLREVDPTHVTLSELPAVTKKQLMANFDRVVTDGRLRRVDIEAHMNGERVADLYLHEYQVAMSGGSSGLHHSSRR